MLAHFVQYYLHDDTHHCFQYRLSFNIGCDKTSLSMGLAADSPGALSNVLSLFAKSSVNLLLISSSSGGGGRSNFYVEVDGHEEEERTRVALEEVRCVADYCIVLGSFQKMKL